MPMFPCLFISSQGVKEKNASNVLVSTLRNEIEATMI
jgi:hypothetical protein